jgi:hypothetical protein
MTQEDYNFVNSFRDVLEHFVKHGTYVGGAENLFLKYLQPNELGCSSCKSACMIQRLNELEQYDASNL